LAAEIVSGESSAAKLLPETKVDSRARFRQNLKISFLPETA